MKSTWLSLLQWPYIVTSISVLQMRNWSSEWHKWLVMSVTDLSFFSTLISCQISLPFKPCLTQKRHTKGKYKNIVPWKYLEILISKDASFKIFLTSCPSCVNYSFINLIYATGATKINSTLFLFSKNLQSRSVRKDCSRIVSEHTSK